MPILSLLSATQTLTTDISEPQDADAIAARQLKRRVGAGRGLAHLVSKFEGLESVSRSTNPLSLRGTARAPVTLSATSLFEPPPAPSSITTSSLCTSARNPPTSQDFASQESSASNDKVQCSWQPGRPETVEKGSSVVAERKKIFEVNLGATNPDKSHSTGSTDGPARQGSKLRLPARWQTVRARSPLACLAQSQAAVLSCPKRANVSKRLSGYLPLSSTYPSLPNAEKSAKPHRLSACGIHPAEENNQYKTISSVIEASGPLQAPKPTDMHPSRLTLNTSESTSTAQARPPSRPESQKSLIPKARDDRAVPHIESAPSKSGKEEETDKLPLFVGFQPTPSVSKARSKLPLRQHIKRKSHEFKHGPSHLTSPVLLHNEMSVEAAVAQLEATPKQPAFSAPSQIENKIGLFESLIAKEKTNGKSKYSIRYKARIPASVSCQVVHQPKPGITEEVRRKSSSSWGPARWRQRPIVHNIETEQHAAQDEPKSISRRGEDQRVPSDGPMETVRSSLSGNWEIWTDNINNPEKEKKSDGSLPRVSSINQPESDTQHPQNDPASVGSYVGQWGQGSKSMQVTQTGERRRTWRLSGRRWTSRSNTPFIARVNCALEQPQPVRVNEMKRLVSLCREKMTMRKDRAQTD